MIDPIAKNPFRVSTDDSGFTLVELLITIVFTGIIVLGMLTSYLNMQSSTYNQTEIVDVQQSLRVAVDLMGKDVRMAGFMVPFGTNPIAGGSGSNVLNIVTASSDYTFATLNGEQIISGGKTVTDDVGITLTTAEQLDFFKIGDSVRIIRPNDGSQPLSNVFTVMAINDGRGDLDDPSDDVLPVMTLNGFDNATPINFVGGDVVARVNPGMVFPSTVSWSLNSGDLQRVVDGGVQTDVLVNNIDSLQFDYLLRDGDQVSPPAADDLENIASVRITLTAAAANQVDKVSRMRSMSSLFRIMN